LLTVAAALAAILGYAWLALAMKAHWRQVQRRDGPSDASRRVLRILGSLALLSSGAICFAANRPSMAVLVWIMLLAAAAPLIALALAWRPAALRWLWPARSTLAD
jgi:hypothetical protein